MWFVRDNPKEVIEAKTREEFSNYLKQFSNVTREPSIHRDDYDSWVYATINGNRTCIGFEPEEGNDLMFIH